MPLLDPVNNPIESILEVAGVSKKNQNLSEKLKSSRLGTENLLDGVAEIVSNGDNDNVRLQAIKIALQLNPETRMAMNDEANKPTPQVNITIIDSKAVAINPIMFPRKAQDKVA